MLAVVLDGVRGNVERWMRDCLGRDISLWSVGLYKHKILVGPLISHARLLGLLRCVVSTQSPYPANLHLSDVTLSIDALQHRLTQRTNE